MGGCLKADIKNWVQKQNKPRWLAIGIALLLLFLVYLLVFMPIGQLYSDVAEDIDKTEFSLRRYARIAAEKDYWLARIRTLREQGKTAEHFITRDTAALASADLQSRIKATVTGAGGELISTQVIPDHAEDQFIRIAVKVRLTCSTEILRQILHETESSQPILFVEDLNIRPIRLPGGTGRKGPKERLSVDFDVVGYMLVQGQDG